MFSFARLVTLPLPIGCDRLAPTEAINCNRRDGDEKGEKRRRDLRIRKAERRQYPKSVAKAPITPPRVFRPYT